MIDRRRAAIIAALLPGRVAVVHPLPRSARITEVNPDLDAFKTRALASIDIDESLLRSVIEALPDRTLLAWLPVDTRLSVELELETIKP